MPPHTNQEKGFMATKTSRINSNVTNTGSEVEKYYSPGVQRHGHLQNSTPTKVETNRWRTPHWTQQSYLCAS